MNTNADITFNQGVFTVSIDFELYWGVRDNWTIEQYKNNSHEYDSLMSVIKYDDFLVDQNAKPINCAFGHWHLLTQELRESYQLTGGIYMAPKDKQLQWSYWFGPKPYMHEISKIESMDVDDQQDFEICELFHLNKNGQV